MGHSIIPPSSAWIWGKEGGCTMWPLMNQMYPELEPSQDALEGTASHEIGEGIIQDIRKGKGSHVKEDWVSITASNGVVITEEMFDAAKIYADDVAQVMKSTDTFGGPNLRVEEKVNAPRVHELSNGTPDCSLYHKAGNTLYVWDYKYGRRVVDAFENLQGVNYVAGLLDHYGIDGSLDQDTEVRIRIIQPRAFHREGVIREWVTKASELRGLINTLNANASEALGPSPKFRTGEHCRDCAGRHTCSAALKVGLGLYEVVMEGMPVELPVSALGLQLSIVKRARKQLEYLESGLEEQVKGSVRSGDHVPGWALEETYGHPAWKAPAEEVIALGDMVGLDLKKPPGVITPTQAKKLGLAEDVLKEFSARNKAGLKLVPDDNTKARKVFKL